MNIKQRLKNKTFIITMSIAIVSFIYQILSIIGLTPTISQDDTMNIIMIIVNLLTGIGILVDPTTEGFGDKIEKKTE